jgi:hypothetical protein
MTEYVYYCQLYNQLYVSTSSITADAAEELMLIYDFDECFVVKIGEL